MGVSNTDIATIFEEISELLEIQDANPFRVRAYRNAARELRSLRTAAADLVAREQDLAALPAIGEDLAAKIEEIVRTGKCRALQELREQVPPGLTELLKIPGLGPKRVATLNEELDIHTVAALERAARKQQIRALHGFGEKTESAILEALGARTARARRLKLASAAGFAEPLAEHLARTPGVQRVVIAGSYRRCRETVGDLDVLVTASDWPAVMERFVDYDPIARVVARGTTRATAVLESGLQVDLRVVDEACFGAALHYFTGSKAHNIEIRRLGQKKKLKINEYGVFAGRERIAGDTEASVFASVGLPFIPPELRENRGEIDAARANALPHLIEREDLRGDLHASTEATDGRDGLQDMAEAARRQGLSYLAVTEHSAARDGSRGVDARRLQRSNERIERLNERLEGIRLLKGVEVEILDDGKLDLPDGVLSELDLVIGSVRSWPGRSRGKLTTRILKAMDHPHFTLLAQPRDDHQAPRRPYEVDMPRIVRHARERGCFLELSAHPSRIDLLDVHCQMAKDEGVLIAISSGARSVDDFDNLRFGVGQARRGWLEKRDALNTRSLKSLLRLLDRGS